METIKLNANISFPDQLKKLRVKNKITLTEMAKKIKLMPSNIYHYETQNKANYKNPFASVKNHLTETGIRYAKALGANKIEITI